MTSKLALFGGEKAIKSDPGDMFKWPIVTEEDEQAVLEVLRKGKMSGTDITKKFEKEFAEWNGTKYGLGFCNGTSSLLAAMYGCGLGVGDEMISPSVTYWASTVQAMSLGASVVFADIQPDSLCIDPQDIEKKITKNTKAIMVVHYLGHPADMDPIMEIAKKHNLKVIEDVSHAQGGFYKGRKLGTIGDVGAMSLMTGKSFAVGEGGMLVTDDTEIYERALILGHYERHRGHDFANKKLDKYSGLPWGGYKFRMHQMSSAMGRVQLKYYDDRIAEIRKSMNYFWDLLEDVPGVRAHRIKTKDSNMAGWYAPHGHYVPEELEGLSVTRFMEAVRAEGYRGWPGCNKPLHTHALFSEVDIYGHGKPTRVANSDNDIRKLDVNLNISENIASRLYSIPWFIHFRPEIIEEYANAFCKVANNYKELLKDDPGNPVDLGGYNFFKA